MSQYPDEEVTLFVWRHFGSAPRRSELRFLDLGCGQGATAWFLAREGYCTTALDGSPSALRHTAQRARREGLPMQLVRGELTQLPFASSTFHCATDVMSTCCNPADEVATALAEVHRVLVPGGLVFSRLPRATPRMGHYEGLGTISFMERVDIDLLFSQFDRTAVGLSTRQSDDADLAPWDVIPQKSPRPEKPISAVGGPAVRDTSAAMPDPELQHRQGS